MQKESFFYSNSATGKVFIKTTRISEVIRGFMTLQNPN